MTYEDLKKEIELEKEEREEENEEENKGYYFPDFRSFLK